MTFANANGEEASSYQMCFCYLLIRVHQLLLKKKTRPNGANIKSLWNSTYAQPLPDLSTERDMQLGVYSYNASLRVNYNFSFATTFGDVRLVHETKQGGFMTDQDRKKIQKYKKRTSGGNGSDDNREEQSSTFYAESKDMLKLIDSIRQVTSDKFLPEQCTPATTTQEDAEQQPLIRSAVLSRDREA
jgi:hypothetical protein